MRGVAGWLIVLLLAGCTDYSKPPADIIPKGKMEKILWDMVKADRFTAAFIMTKKDSLDEKKKQAFLFYEKVFNLHGISRKEFLKSYKYYLGRPDITKVLFDSITAQAERRREEMYKRTETDSLLNSNGESLNMNKRDSVLTK